MRRAALALALVLVACAPKGSHPAQEGGLRFTGGPFTETEKALCREAWAFHTRRWEADNGPAPVPLGAEVVYGLEVEPGGIGGEVVGGGYVRVAAWSDMTCPAVYHELCHLALMRAGTDGDPQHLDPRWYGWSVNAQDSINALVTGRAAGGHP